MPPGQRRRRLCLARSARILGSAASGPDGHAGNQRRSATSLLWRPGFTYSLKQGIEDGFLAPYKVIRIATDVDAVGYTPEKAKVDNGGQAVEQRQYNTKDFDRTLVLESAPAGCQQSVGIPEGHRPDGQDHRLCDDQDHAERMRQELVKLIPAAASNRRYVMRITGDDTEGKAQLSYFRQRRAVSVIATTSKLLTTGGPNLQAHRAGPKHQPMTEFKQMIGRGTRLREDYQKLYFTIMDFKGATRLFADPEFDGEPVVIYEPQPDEPVVPPGVCARSRDTLNLGEPGTRRMGTWLDRWRRRPRQIRDRRCCRAPGWSARNTWMPTASSSPRTTAFCSKTTSKALQTEFGTMTDFLRRWNGAERKQAVLEELADHGVPLGNIAAGRDQRRRAGCVRSGCPRCLLTKTATRRERANNVKNATCLVNMASRPVPCSKPLLDKFATTACKTWKMPGFWLPPFDQFGSKTQIGAAYSAGSSNTPRPSMSWSVRSTTCLNKNKHDLFYAGHCPTQTARKPQMNLQ